MGICAGKQTSANEYAHKAANVTLKLNVILYIQNLQLKNKQVNKLDDLKVKKSDLIAERKGKFRDFYSFGPQLGTGMH